MEYYIMPVADLLLTFLAAVVLFAVVPGPAMLYTAARTLAGGREAGLMAALGIHLGAYVHIAAAVLGLSLALHSAPELFLVMKLVGAAYLAWLGVALFRNVGSISAPVGISKRASSYRAFFESVAVEVLNPATTIFFISFLPLFLDPSSGVPIWVQLITLGVLTNFVFSAVEIVVVLTAGSCMLQFRKHRRAQGRAQRAAGSILVVLAFYIGLAGGIA
jgi:threonine/homoserine/homoserine lactone efflux protein